MADQQDHRIRRLEELEAKNNILRENLAQYKALEEALLSQKVYENARRSLVGWLSAGSVAIFLFGYIGFDVIADRIVVKAVPEVKKVAIIKAEEALKRFTQDLDTLKRGIFLGKYKGTGQRRSQQAETQIEIEFVNTLDEMVVVYWIDYDGNKKEYFKLQPGASRKQITYVTHPWIVTTKDDKEVGSIIGQLKGKRLVIGAKQ